MTPRIGELFAGYGGLGMGVQAVFGGEVVWYSEIDKGALKILEHRFPDVPNVGDVTTADWSKVEPVDILTGGSPCQDLSHAGKRAGMTEGARSNLWVAMREAIAQLRPPTVVWENVRGAYSAAADSEVEPCAGCVGDGPGVHLRALGRVLGDLSELGYDTRWHGLRAADVGAPHGRFRVFVVARDTSGHIERHGGLSGANGQRRDEGPTGAADRATADSRRLRGREGWTPGPGEASGGRALGDPAGRGLLPTPRATDGTKGGSNQRGSSGDLMLPSAVLPTPKHRDFKNAGAPGRAAERASERAQDLPEVIVNHLLPTPVVTDAKGARNATSGRKRGSRHNDGVTLGDVAHANLWGDYAAAIARWEHALGRPAPAPTVTSTKGNPQLAPAFVEWMMGLPAGWVTEAPGITRNEALKALGNGVVPQQAAAALRAMLAWEAVA